MSTSDSTTLHVRARNAGAKIEANLLIDTDLKGNVFGQGKDSQAILLSSKAFEALISEEGDSGFFYVEGDDVKRTPVMISEIQTDSLTGAPIHVALQRINMKQKVTSEIAVELEGELEVKEATALLVRNYIEVEALPDDLPDTFVIDISKFEAVGDAVYIKDLGLDTAKVTVLLSEEEMEDPIVIVKEVKEEVEEEVPAEGEEATEEGGEESVESSEETSEESSDESEE